MTRRSGLGSLLWTKIVNGGGMRTSQKQDILFGVSREEGLFLPDFTTGSKQRSHARDHQVTGPTGASMSKCKAAKFSWARVAKAGEDECWPWTGWLNTWGYGACQYGGKQVNASRAAYIESNGGIADGLVVCHRCDNPACCNPKHLFAGTQAENNADCRNKGRHRFQSGPEHARAAAKLTPELVIEAKRLYANGVSQSEIGRRWGLHSSVISRAVRNITWSHVGA